MTGHAILQDTSLCMECQACRVACQAQNGLRPDQVLVRLHFAEQGSFPQVTHQVSRLTCLHCTDATCVRACPTGAIYKGESGFTHYAAGRCSGCGYCAELCPFGIPTIEEGRALRCTGCEPLVTKGEAPACVSTCISGALSYAPRDTLLERGARRVAALQPRFPDAQLYSPSGVGQTALIWVLRDRPAVYGLPEDPKVNPLVGVWKDFVQPVGLAAAGAALAVGALGAIIARRNHLREMKGEGDHDAA